MKLLREINELSETNFLKEDGEVPGVKNYYIEGVFIQADLQNRNGRIYPSDVIENAVEVYREAFINKRRAFGELDHPNTPNLNLSRASHLITELTREGSNWIGRAKIMDNEHGKRIKNFMDEGCTLGISSRGLGSTKTVRGSSVIQDDFFFITAGDIVADPSAPDAFLNNLVEGIEWAMREDGTWLAEEQLRLKAKADEITREYGQLKEEKEEAFLALFQKFLQKL